MTRLHHIGAREIHRYQSRRQGLRPDIQRLPITSAARCSPTADGLCQEICKGACRISAFNSTLSGPADNGELLQTTGAIPRRYAGSVSAPSADDMAVLARASKAFPYCTAIDMLMLRSPSLTGNSAQRLEMKIMLASRQCRCHRKRRGGDFCGASIRLRKTNRSQRMWIDLFVQTYGRSSPAEDAMLERMIFNPTPDYGEVLRQRGIGNICLPGTGPMPTVPKGV